LKFSKEMDPPSNWKSMLNDEIIELNVQPSESSDASKLGFSYDFTEFVKDELVLELTFENPVYVSAEDQNDVLKITLFPGI